MRVETSCGLVTEGDNERMMEGEMKKCHKGEESIGDITSDLYF